MNQIGKENFKKLKQNNRIEYLLRLNRIEEKFKDYHVIDNFVFFVIGLNLWVITMFAINQELFLPLLELIPKFIAVIIIYVVILFAINLTRLFNRYKWTKELNEEFFEVKTK